MREIVVTGVGLVSGLARDAETHFARLLGGHAALELVDPPGPAFPGMACAAVGSIDRREVVETRILRRALSDTACFGLMAASAALKGAGLAKDVERLRDTGLYVGSVCLEATAEMLAPALRESVDAQGRFDQLRFGERGMSLIDPLFLVRSLPNAGIGGIAIEHQLLGPNLNLTNGAVSGLQSVIAAASTIGRGEIDIALAGGYDSARQLDSMIEHMLAGRLATDPTSAAEACRPFAGGKGGYGLGEGAAFLVLEEAASARKRGARALARVLGVGERCSVPILSALNTEDPSSESLAGAARAALEDGACTESEVDLVVGDALGVSVDDARESSAFLQLFEEGRTGYYGATPALGFTGAASSAFSVAHGVLALKSQRVPPTLNAGSFAASTSRSSARRLQRVLCWCSDRGVKSAALLLGALGAEASA